MGTPWQPPWGHRPRWDPWQHPTDTGTPHLRRAHGSTHRIPAALGPPHPPPTPLSGPPPSPLTSGKSQSPPCGRHSPGGAPSEMLRARSSQGPTAAGLTLRARAAQFRSGTRLQENCGVMGEKGGQRGEGTPRTPPPQAQISPLPPSPPHTMLIKAVMKTRTTTRTAVAVLRVRERTMARDKRCSTGGNSWDGGGGGGTPLRSSQRTAPQTHGRPTAPPNSR